MQLSLGCKCPSKLLAGGSKKMPLKSLKKPGSAEGSSGTWNIWLQHPVTMQKKALVCRYQLISKHHVGELMAAAHIQRKEIRAGQSEGVHVSPPALPVLRAGIIRGHPSEQVPAPEWDAVAPSALLRKARLGEGECLSQDHTRS